MGAIVFVSAVEVSVGVLAVLFVGELVSCIFFFEVVFCGAVSVFVLLLRLVVHDLRHCVGLRIEEVWLGSCEGLSETS